MMMVSRSPSAVWIANLRPTPGRSTSRTSIAPPELNRSADQPQHHLTAEAQRAQRIQPRERASVVHFLAETRRGGAAEGSGDGRGPEMGRATCRGRGGK